jgi:hypothetical protein
VKSLTLSGNVDLVTPDLTIEGGGLTWHAGTVEGDRNGDDGEGTIVLGTGTTSTIDGDVVLAGAELDNHGTLLWTAGTLVGDAGAIIRNFGSMTASSGTAFGYLSGSDDADLYNTGTFTFTGPGTLSTEQGYWGLHNQGTLVITSGVFELHNPGNTQSTLEDGNHVSGAGTLRFIEPTQEFGVASPTASVSLSGTTTIEQGATIELAHGSELLGSGTISGPGDLIWSGGSIHGGTPDAPIVWAKSLTVLMSSSDVKNLAGGTVENRGTVIWSGGDLGGSADTLFVNRGTFNVSGDLKIDYSPEGGSNTSTFANHGTLTKVTGSGALKVQSWGLENYDTLDVQSGRVELQSADNLVHVLHDGSTQKGKVVVTEPDDGYATVSATGTITLASGATLEFAVGGELEPVHAVFKGPGTTVFKGGSVVVEDDDTLLFDSSSQVTFTSGAATSGITVSDSGSFTLGGKTTWSSGSIELWDGSLVNSGTLTVKTAGELTVNTSGASLVNKGTLISDPGSGTVQLDMSVTNAGTIESRSGKLLFAGYVDGTYVQTKGALKLSGGSVAAYVPGDQDSPNDPRPLQIDGGRLEGSGDIDAVVVSAGLIAPGGTGAVGALHISQTLTQNEKGSLELELQGKGAGEFDRLEIDGDVTLAGDLDVLLLSGESLHAGDSLVVITSAGDDAIAGTLTLHEPANATLKATYHAHDVTVGIRSITEPPSDAGADAGAGADDSDAGSDDAGSDDAGSDEEGDAGEPAHHHSSGGCSVLPGSTNDHALRGLGWLLITSLSLLVLRRRGRSTAGA